MPYATSDKKVLRQNKRTPISISSDIRKALGEQAACPGSGESIRLRLRGKEGARALQIENRTGIPNTPPVATT